MSIIDNIFEFTVNDYHNHQIMESNSDRKRFPSVMIINWLKRNESPKATSGSNGSEKVEVKSGGQDLKQGLGFNMSMVENSIPDYSRIGPMLEKDWDYVFQANKILSCSYVDPHTSQISRASHAGISSAIAIF